MVLRPPVVYLDTQDYSRFGDVLRGKSDAVHEALFLELERRKLAGEVIFAPSMLIFGELLQYDENFRETTICKAQSVERLCGSWALIFPTRLIAAEIVTIARAGGLLPMGPPIETLTSDRYWYPNVSDVFCGLRGTIKDGIGPQLNALNLTSRKIRRSARKLASKMDFATVARDAAPEMAAKYDLPVEVFHRSIVAFLRKQITAEQASRALFGAIAEPVKFVETYFERVETDRSMPTWIGSFGQNYQEILETMRSRIEPFIQMDDAREKLDGLLSEWPAKLGRTALSLAGEDVKEFGMDPALRDTLSSDPEFVVSVPAARIVGQILPAYARQVFGLKGNAAKIESSFGGDLMHALYLPHVDLWRTDKRFSGVVTGAVPEFADRVVSTAQKLPAAIDAWLASN